MSVPDGAQLSEDGNYWWDGTEWQPVDSQSAQEMDAETQEQVKQLQQEMDSDEGLQELMTTDLSSLSDDED